MKGHLINRTSILGGALLALSPASASAADLCKATVLRPVHANEDTKSVMRPGETNTAITQFVRESKTGRTSFCSHGGYCYPTHVVVGGKRLLAQRLLNCRVDMAHPDPAADEIIYPLIVDRRRNSAAALREDDVENRLLDMGMCNACAGTAAIAYVRRPSSPCGQLTRQALEGNPTARRKLADAPENACTAEWH